LRTYGLNVTFGAGYTDRASGASITFRACGADLAFWALDAVRAGGTVADEHHIQDGSVTARGVLLRVEACDDAWRHRA
jgi:hypothetical protein